MSKNIPETLRRTVAVRAHYKCEYCRRPEMDSFIRYQSDHIISRKHGGKTILNNLAHGPAKVLCLVNVKKAFIGVFAFFNNDIIMRPTNFCHWRWQNWVHQIKCSHTPEIL